MRTNLQKLRKAAGYKSAKLYAAHMGINYNTYTDYEQGRITMSLETAWTIADDLGCTLDELAGRKSPSATLDERESAILRAYREMDADHRRIFRDMAVSLSPQIDAREKGVA